MKNGSKNKFEGSILTPKMGILRVYSVFWGFLKNGMTVSAQERLIWKRNVQATILIYLSDIYTE